MRMMAKDGNTDEIEVGIDYIKRLAEERNDEIEIDIDIESFQVDYPSENYEVE